MAFVDRKKQAHLWRDGALAPQHMTPEQVVKSTLTNIAAGVAVDLASNLIAKAFKRFGLPVPAGAVAEVVAPVVDAVVAEKTAPKSPRRRRNGPRVQNPARTERRPSGNRSRSNPKE